MNRPAKTPLKTRYDYTTSGLGYIEACDDIEKNLVAQFEERELPKWFIRFALRFIAVRARCDGTDCKKRLRMKARRIRKNTHGWIREGELDFCPSCQQGRHDTGGES